jgi:heme exporter protein B
MLRVAWLLARKDLVIELRGRRASSVLLPFVGCVLLLFGFAFGPGRSELRALAPAAIWLSTLFAAVLSFRASFDADAEDAAGEEVVLSPIDPASEYLGRVAASAVELMLLLAGSSLVAWALFALGGPGSLGTIVLVGAAGVLGLSGIGTSFAALVSRARAREALLPVLLLPLATPLLIGTVRGTELALAGEPQAAIDWLGLLVAFDVVALSAGILTAAATQEPA